MRGSTAAGCIGAGLIYLTVFVLAAPPQQGCTILIEFNHGGFYDGRTQTDSIVAELIKTLLEEELPDCYMKAIANTIDSTLREAPPLEKELITRESLVEAEQDQIDGEWVVPGAQLFKVSYSASGGPTLELFANPNLGAYSPHLQESLNQLLRAYSDLDVNLHVVLVDPYPPLISHPSDAETFAHELWNKLRQGPLASVTAIRFTQPLWTAPAERLASEVDSIPQWLADFFGQHPLAGVPAKGVAWLAFDVPLGREWALVEDIDAALPPETPMYTYELPYRHDQLPESLTEVVAVMAEIAVEGPSRKLANRPPTFSPTSLAEEKTVYYEGGGGLGHSRGRYLLMSPSWLHTGCLTVTDPDGDDLSIYLGSTPAYGMANVFSSHTGQGRYSVTVSYQISNEEIRMIHQSRDDLTDSFTVVADDHRGGRASAVATITIKVPNRNPLAQGDAATTYVEQPVTVPVLANDSDPEGDPLTIVAVTQPLHGTVAVADTGVTYTPEAHFCGTDSFSYAVSDGYGGEATGNVTVTVVDNVPPTVVTKNITVYLDEDGRATIAPQDVDGGSSDNCGIASMSVNPNSFTCADLGPNTVILTVTDTSGNQASAQATVTVADDIPPAVTVPSDVTIECGEATAPANTGQATATDNCDPNPQITYSDAVSGSCPEVITRTWTVTDASGNSATGVQTITVQDTTPPEVHCPGDITVETHDPTGATVAFTVTASDMCDPHPTVTCTPASGSEFPIGTTTVTCTATDACGNTGSPCQFLVVVGFVNHPPVAYDASWTADAFGGVDTRIELQAFDPDGDPLTFVIVSGPQRGNLFLGEAPNVFYYHAHGQCVDCYDSFTFKVNDGWDDSDIATVTIYLDP